MNISNISALKDINTYLENYGVSSANRGGNVGFQSILDSAAALIQETNDLSNKAEEEEIRYAMGLTDNIANLQVAQQKANISLQYTVAVRDAFVDAYKEIMNLQF